jgi:NADPH:quinone reductase-like Zn-dependent oxidoreductase
MKSVRIHEFGPPDVIVIDDLPQPMAPTPGEVLVRVEATGVGPWDALIREGKSKVAPRPPLTLGSDLSGEVEFVGPGVTEFKVGDHVYGVTNRQFCGANAEYALASADMLARKPHNLSHAEAASVPVVGVTAWQMLFDYGQVAAGQTVLILGAAGNVGRYAMQFAKDAGAHIVATSVPKDMNDLKTLGADIVVDYRAEGFEMEIPPVDVVIDTVGGATREKSLASLKPGGILVSVVSTEPLPQRDDVRFVFFYVEVTTARLKILSELFETGKLSPKVGSVLPLEEARIAHEMLGGARPRKPGKIVLSVTPAA